MKIQKQLLHFALATMFSLHCYAQHPDSLYKEFKKNVLFFQEQNGSLYWDDEVKLSYYNLIEKSPLTYLIKLTDDENPAIRANIYRGLTIKTKDTVLLKTILDKHKHDTALFTELYEDLGTDRKVNDFMKENYRFKLSHHLNSTILLDRFLDIKQQPHIIIKGVSHKYISKKNLLGLDSLEWSNKNVTVTSFQLFINDTTLTSNSNKLTPAMKDAISKLIPNDLVVFHIIKGTDERKNPVGLPSVSLWIRN